MKRSVHCFVLFILLSGLQSCSQNSTPGSMNHPADDQEQPDSLFRNPILTRGPDPWVFQYEDQYYVTHTTGNNITLYRTEKMSALSSAASKVVWTPPAAGPNSSGIWAPEIHRVEGKWYIYYAADDGDNANHRMWVLENSSEDPFAGTWMDKGKMELPDDKWAIDGSPFELDGQWYFVWSGWEGNVNVQQNIYIAKMQTPTQTTGARVLLTAPTLPWETNATSPTVVEGPQFIRRADKAHIVYSAGGCWTDGYSLGLLTANVQDNPLQPGSWSKSTEPVFVTNSTGNAHGPGHNGFFQSADGTEDWIIYHANPSPGQGCGDQRSIRIQKFTWDESGFPVFGEPVPLNSRMVKPSGEF